MTNFQIDVISDFVCVVSNLSQHPIYSKASPRPTRTKQWCFVAKRNLDAAVALYNKTYPSARTHDTFTITYRPYYLSAHSNLTHSVPKSQLAEKKLGHLSQDKRAALTRKMEQVGRAVGIHFKYGGMIGPPQDAQRLVYMSRGKSDVQGRLVERLFEAYHEQERDIADRETLREIATAAGLSDEDVDEALMSEEVARVVDEEEAKYREVAREKGVPVYVIQGEHRVDGAQDASDFMEIFVKIKEAEAEKA